MSALYNEIEPYAAAWLRNLSEAGHVAPGSVDARSIRDLRADDLVGATQFHTFAGLGAWSYALRLAGWPDDRPVWTGSCPCQPFSVAGKRGGTADKRHLWPEWFRLIRECRPPVVFGEQVASGDGLAWLDVVRADLEGEGYAVGAADLCAAGVGAPHIRQRLFFGAVRVGNAYGSRLAPRDAISIRAEARSEQSPGAGLSVRVANAGSEGRQQVGADDGGRRARGVAEGLGQRPLHGGAVVVADPQRPGLQARPPADLRGAGRGEEGREPGHPRVVDAWGNPDWLPCRDGKARPVEPGTFPLAYGAPARVGRLRAYGNAIVPQVAAGFVRAFMEATS